MARNKSQEEPKFDSGLEKVVKIDMIPSEKYKKEELEKLRLSPNTTMFEKKIALADEVIELLLKQRKARGGEIPIVRKQVEEILKRYKEMKNAASS